jgi:rRNA maturation RNase YbeY
VLGAVGRGRAELSLSLVDDAEMRTLNRRYRAKDRPTDVLAFPLHEPPLPARVASLGDVVISIDTAAVAARQQRRSLARCLDALVIHGVLHLLGYDHEISAAEARRMARRAAEVRAAIGPLAAPAAAVSASVHARPPRRRRTATKASAR